MRLRRQILLAVMGAMAMALLPTIAFLTWTARQSLLQKTEVDGVRIAQILAISAGYEAQIPNAVAGAIARRNPSADGDRDTLLARLQQPLSLQRLIYKTLDSESVHGIWIVDRQLKPIKFGTISGLGLQQTLSPADQALVQNTLIHQRSEHTLQGNYLNVATPITDAYGQLNGAVLLYLPITAVRTTLREQLGLAMGIIALVGLVGIIMSHLLSRWLTQPIDHLNAVAKAIAQDNLDTPIEARRNDEVGELADSFNQMAQRLKTAFACLEDRVAERTAQLETKTHQLQQSETQTKAILRAIPDLMFRVNASGIYLGYVKTREMLDLLPKDFKPVGRHISEFLPPEIAQRHLHFMQQAIATRTIQLYEQRNPINGDIQYEEVRVVASGDDEVLFMIRDISDRKRAEAKRQQAEANLRQSHAELAETLKTLQTAQNDLIQSEKMAALGQLVAGVAHEVNTPLGAIRSSVSNMTRYLDQTLEYLPDLFRSFSEDESQQFSQLLQRSLHHNLFLSLREERELRRSLTHYLKERDIEAADATAETLVIMGIHDAIDPFLPLLQKPDQAAILEVAYKLSGLQRSTQTIDTATERASKVVFALKNYARQDYSGDRTQTQITQGIDTVLTLYHNQIKRGIEVIRHYAEVPPIWGYPDELHQVWTNLIHNAIQAMDSQGVLTIQVALQHGTAADGTDQNSEILVSLTDNGKGIPLDIQDKIFHPFFTTKPSGEGSGLGLNIVKKIIDRHRGYITVTSQPGCTRFEVRLPVQ